MAMAYFHTYIIPSLIPVICLRTKFSFPSILPMYLCWIWFLLCLIRSQPHFQQWVYLVYFNLGYFLCPWSNFCKPVKYAAWYCIECCMCVRNYFICIFTFLVWFLMDLEFQFSVIISEKSKAGVSLNVSCDPPYIVFFISGMVFFGSPKFIVPMIG